MEYRREVMSARPLDPHGRRDFPVPPPPLAPPPMGFPLRFLAPLRRPSAGPGLTAPPRPRLLHQPFRFSQAPTPPLRGPALSAGPALSRSLSTGPALAASFSEAPPLSGTPLPSLSAHPAPPGLLRASLSLVLVPRSSPPPPVSARFS